MIGLLILAFGLLGATPAPSVAGETRATAQPASPVWPEAGASKDFAIAVAQAGDTIDVGEEKSVKLLNVEAPGPGDPFFNESRTALSQFLAQGGIRCIATGTPPTQSTYFAICSSSAGDIGKLMIQAGWAVPKLAVVPAESRATLASAYRAAVHDRRGQWQSADAQQTSAWSLSLQSVFQLLGSFIAVLAAYLASRWTAKNQRTRDDAMRVERKKAIAAGLAAEVDAALLHIKNVAIGPDGNFLPDVQMRALASVSEGALVYKANTAGAAALGGKALAALTTYHAHLAQIQAEWQHDLAVRSGQALKPSKFALQTILRTIQLGLGVLDELSETLAVQFPKNWPEIEVLKTANSKIQSTDPAVNWEKLEIEKRLPFVAQSGASVLQ